ncbi:MAG TPA: metallophosphoesterase [Clostridia bacterium]|nr:metallophosphoesterase [Clostridia bacterium]
MKNSPIRKNNCTGLGMKKIISLIVMLIMIASLSLPLVSCTSKPDFDFAFITDLHVVANSHFTEENYEEYSKSNKFIHITEAILNSLVDELIDRDYKYVFVGGDITDNGDEASHLVAAAAFKRLEDNGVDVYVVNGNHDLPENKGQIGRKISPTRFKEIYKDFGYEEAIVSSPNTLSYVANINKKYRLIGIDNMVHYGDSDEDIKPENMSESNIKWLKEQAAKCVKDKVTPIAIVHDTLLDHYPMVAQIVLDRTISEQNEKLVNQLANNGMRFVFAGHDHLQDTVSYTTANGNELYEVAAGPMAYYPLSYKEMSFKKKDIVVNTRNFDKINTKYLPSVCPDSIKEELEKGLQDYAYKFVEDYLAGLCSSVPSMIKALGITGDAKNAVDIFADDIIVKVINNPFYIKDENNNTSLERILQAYNMGIPQSDYKNMADIIPILVTKILGGNEDFAESAELNLIKYSIYSMFYYLDELSAQFKEALPNEPIMDINLDLLFTQGILECYDSNLMDLIFAIVKGFNSDVGRTLKAIIGSDFNEIGGEVASTFIKAFTKNVVDDLDEYFQDKNILLEKFIDDGIWGKYGKDFVTDNPPSDTYLEIEIG